MKKYSLLFLLMLVVAACGGGDDGDEPTISQEQIDVRPNLSLLGDGQEAELRINANCSWTITQSENWLTVTPSSGTNSETVKVTAGKNSTGAERFATLTIKGKDISRSVVVTQAKSSDSQDFISVAPNLELSGDGQEADLLISANCNWTITCSADWLTVTPSSGSNSETVKVIAGKNSTGAERTATLTIKGNDISRSVVVTQTKSSDSQTPSSSGEPGPNDNQPPT